MEDIIAYLALLIVLCGIIYYAVINMKKFGTVFVIVIFFKWLIGVCITFFAFYVIYLTGDFLKAHDFSIVFSLPVGIFVWFVPMHYTSKVFLFLEDKFKK